MSFSKSLSKTIKDKWTLSTSKKHKYDGTEFIITALPIFIIIALISHAIELGYDNDMWFIITTGRYIIQHGIPYTNPFSVYPDMAFVAQQWLICVIDWLAYSAGGMIGLGIVMLIMCLLLLLAMRFAIRSVVHGRERIFTTWCVVALVISVATSYMSFRPQMITMVLMLCTIGILERYRQSNNPRQLLWLLPIMVIHANTHMSMMWMDVAIAACYAMPSSDTLNAIAARFKPHFNRFVELLLPYDFFDKTKPDAKPLDDRLIHKLSFKQDHYARKPLWIAILMMIAASSINPYGLSGSLYLINSYGAAGYGNYISEMGKLTPMSTYYGITLIITMVIAAMAMGKNGWKHMDMPMTLMVLGTMPVSLANVRSVWIMPMIALPFIVKTLTVPQETQKKKSLNAARFPLTPGLRGCIIVAMIAMSIACTASSFNSLGTEQQYTDSNSTPVKAMETLAGLYPGEADRADIKICTTFNLGGFVEYYGYKVSMDPRPETWQDAITHDGNDRFMQYVDAVSANNSKGAEEIIDSCDFDYVIADNNSQLTIAAMNKGYVTITQGTGYVLLAKNS